MEFTLYNIKNTLVIKYLTNLCNSCIKQSINYSQLQNKINDLKLVNEPDITTEINTEINNTQTDVLSDNTNYLYMKPWIKLNQIHKVIKIKEFVNNFKINNKEKEILKDNLINLLKEKKNKIKLSYDEGKGKIISISSLSFNNGKYIIE